jgi:hypothetical protein
MARTSPTAVSPTLAGAVVTAGTPDATGDIVDPGSYLVVVNGSGGSITVTLQSTATKDGLAVANGGGTVAAGTTRVFGPLISRLFEQAANAATGPNKVLVDYSAVTSVTRYVLKV